jgi:hypothetical protein
MTWGWTRRRSLFASNERPSMGCKGRYKQDFEQAPLLEIVCRGDAMGEVQSECIHSTLLNRHCCEKAQTARNVKL